jgi:hypothetical protein
MTGWEAGLIQCSDRPSGEPVWLDAAAAMFRCNVTSLAGQLLPLSGPPPVRMIVLYSPSLLTPSPSQIHIVSEGYR